MKITLTMILAIIAWSLNAQQVQDVCYWIEPDMTYVQPNISLWPGSPGSLSDNYSDPINLGWNFTYFGTVYNQVVLTTKGTIMLGNSGYLDFTPSSFPTPFAQETTDQHEHICGFWTDSDFGTLGELYYKLTDEALYVNYINVGFWPNQEDLKNSFQMIIAKDGSDVIGNNSNVQFYYKNMEWANGEINGAFNGFNATNNLANVGCDQVSGEHHMQFGRFNLANNMYNGPYGINAAEMDGLYWLNGKALEFNTNIPAVSNTPPGVILNTCPEIHVCQGQTIDFDIQFVSGSASQSVTAALDAALSGLTFTTTPFANGVTVHCEIIGDISNVGEHSVVITGTDNGVPEASTQVSFNVIVSENTSPVLEIEGETSFCPGSETTLTATSGMDNYIWSTGSTLQSVVIDESAEVTVWATLNGCAASATVDVLSNLSIIPTMCNGNSPVNVCSGDTVMLCTTGEYESYHWCVYPGFDGQFVEGTALDLPQVWVVGSVVGDYALEVIDANGCEGLTLVHVDVTQLSIDPMNAENEGLHCEGLQPVIFDEGYSLPAPDNLVIYGLSTNASGWQGSYIGISIVHPDNTIEEYTYTSFSAIGIFDDVIVTAGDSIIIEYFSNGNNFSGNSMWLLNCGESSPTIFSAPLEDGVIWQGMSTCEMMPLTGQWTANGPEGWTFTSPAEFSTEFLPANYGAYSICFETPMCASSLCYELEFAEPVILNNTPQGLSEVCNDDSELYSIAPVSDVVSYTWTLTPAEAGSIVGTENAAQVDYNTAFSGAAMLEVYVSNGICNSNTSALEIFVNDCNLTSENEPSRVRIFPNPTTDRIQIATADKLTYVCVFDMQGREIVKVSSKEVSVRDLASGFYMVYVWTEKGMYRTLLEKK